MSARRFVPGAESWVTEVRHTAAPPRPAPPALRANAASPSHLPLPVAHWPAPGREAVASFRAPAAVLSTRGVWLGALLYRRRSGASAAAAARGVFGAQLFRKGGGSSKVTSCELHPRLLSSA